MLTTLVTLWQQITTVYAGAVVVRGEDSCDRYVSIPDRLKEARRRLERMGLSITTIYEHNDVEPLTTVR